MELWCPFAAKKPLGPQAESNIGTPRVFIVHTMSGFLEGTDSFFRNGGYSGTESHFGVGGSFDGSNDGAVWQWQDLAHSADAQFSGNAHATSVETSDGAHDGVPWSPKQVESIVRLGVWWCQQTGNPPRLVTSPSGAGFGWHAQFPEWNHNGHDCPGATRLKQYKDQIIPEIARRLAGGTEDDDRPKYVSVGITGDPQKLPATGWTTVNWDHDYADSQHQHWDQGGPSILNGPAQYALTAAITLRGVPSGTGIQVRAIEVDETDPETFEAGPLAEYIATSGDTFLLYPLPADSISKGRRLRLQVQQFGTAAASIAGGSAKINYWSTA
jgi:hypothetical protein